MCLLLRCIIAGVGRPSFVIKPLSSLYIKTSRRTFLLCSNELQPSLFNTSCSVIIVLNIRCCTSLYHFEFVDVCLCFGTPDCV